MGKQKTRAELEVELIHSKAREERLRYLMCGMRILHLLRADDPIRNCIVRDTAAEVHALTTDEIYEGLVEIYGGELMSMENENE